MNYYPAPGRLAVMYVEQTDPPQSKGGIRPRETRLLGYLVSINDETGRGVVLRVDGLLTDLETLRERTPSEMALVIQHV